MENQNKHLEEIKKHIRVLQEKIEKFLDKEKPSDVLIIKAHLICEYYINQILILKGICTAKELSKMNFYDKAGKTFDSSNDKQKSIHTRINELNRLRNKVGHELEYILSEADVDTLGYITGKEYVLSKYDFTKLKELLREILIQIVIDIGLLLFELVYEEKSKLEKPRQVKS